MARRPGDVQVQLVMPPEMRRSLGMAALTHEASVETPRTLDRGRMIVLALRWFLSRPRDEQLSVLLEGKRLADADAEPETEAAKLEEVGEERKDPRPPRVTATIVPIEVDESELSEEALEAVRASERAAGKRKQTKKARKK